MANLNVSNTFLYLIHDPSKVKEKEKRVAKNKPPPPPMKCDDVVDGGWFGWLAWLSSKKIFNNRFVFLVSWQYYYLTKWQTQKQNNTTWRKNCQDICCRHTLTQVHFCTTIGKKSIFNINVSSKNLTLGKNHLSRRRSRFCPRRTTTIVQVKGTKIFILVEYQITSH